MNVLRTDYGDLKRSVRGYNIVLKNVDSILDPGAEPRAREIHKTARSAEL